MSKAAEVLNAVKSVLEKLDDADVRLALAQKMVEVFNAADAAKMTPEQLMAKMLPPKPDMPPAEEKKPDAAVVEPAKADVPMCDGCKKPMAECACEKSADKSNADLQKNVTQLQKSVEALTAKVTELTSVSKAATTTPAVVDVKKSVWPAEL